MPEPPGFLEAPLCFGNNCQIRLSPPLKPGLKPAPALDFWPFCPFPEYVPRFPPRPTRFTDLRGVFGCKFDKFIIKNTKHRLHKTQIKHRTQTTKNTNVLVSVFCAFGLYLCFGSCVLCFRDCSPSHFSSETRGCQFKS